MTVKHRRIPRKTRRPGSIGCHPGTHLVPTRFRDYDDDFVVGIQRMYEQRNAKGEREFSQQAIADAFDISISTINRMVRSSLTNVAKTENLADLLRSLSKAIDHKDRKAASS